jgi:Tfp pilus assembly protein PilE
MDRRKMANKQAGISLSGLIGALAVIGVVGIFAMRMVPAYIEYNAIKSAIAQVKDSGGSIREMQQAFNRHTSVNDVEAVRGQDLVFTRDGEDMQISFAYEKRLPLMGNVSLLIDFAGTTDPSGVVAEADSAAP